MVCSSLGLLSRCLVLMSFLAGSRLALSYLGGSCPPLTCAHTARLCFFFWLLCSVVYGFFCRGLPRLSLVKPRSVLSTARSLHRCRKISERLPRKAQKRGKHFSCSNPVRLLAQSIHCTDDVSLNPCCLVTAVSGCLVVRLPIAFRLPAALVLATVRLPAVLAVLPPFGCFILSC
jgi:hypothetical protein